jgi:hypothetical protein
MGKMPLVVGSLASTLLVTACIGGAAPPRAIVVFNFGHTDATYAWQGPGFLGTPILGNSGSTTIRACGAVVDGFWDKARQITITTRIDHVTVEVSRPTDLSVPVPTYAIDAEGHIALVDPSMMPANPTCRP